ncbi:hypothetical protein B0T17DRAFT_520774 [Bombardia bombarda]|uniref:Tat pathway signal sequence n=1 Tax=Bombardia bombarda TaxID=252184 RepID=A0AA39XQA4_9PEZI|nr:hypothetical protein B0T17DRAFT_520774 [Bombardia bombarda]
MADHREAQYLRLRNLGGSDTVTMLDDIEPPEPEYLTPARRGKGVSHRFRRLFSKKVVIFVSLLFNIAAFWALLASSHPHDRILTYFLTIHIFDSLAPALSAVENERVVFSSAFGIERSPFQGEPSPANDELWADLYDFGITRVSAAEARPMDNKTLPVPDERGGYLVQLAVFHQLHCLNLIRKGIYGDVDFSNIDDLMGIEHLDHCIDMLRQSIMCNSDVTPITFARTSLDSSMKVVAEVVHTCRSFSKIQQWAWNRRVVENIDKNKVVTGDPLGWGSYVYSP